VLAFLRGAVEEVLGVGAWVGAVVLSLALRPAIEPLVQGVVGNDPPWLAQALAVSGIFLIVLVTLKLAIAAIARRVQDSALGGTDRALGLVFGLGRGAFLVVVAYILGGMVVPAADRWPEAVRDARSLPLVVDAATWLVDRLPPEYQPRVAAPPIRRLPSLEELMRPDARSRT
jgi:membrane protein required for colicin V production